MAQIVSLTNVGLNGFNSVLGRGVGIVVPASAAAGGAAGGAGKSSGPPPGPPTGPATGVTKGTKSPTTDLLSGKVQPKLQISNHMSALNLTTNLFCFSIISAATVLRLTGT